MGCYGLWFPPNHFGTAFPLFAANVLANRINVVIELRGIYLTMFPDFFDDWIMKHGYVSMSSWGVQIVGGSNP